MSLLVSVIVPTFKRQDLLARCLDTLAPGAQSLSSQAYEVIVTDDSGQLKQLVESQYPWAQWTRGPGQGPAANRNHGAKLAKGDWLAFIDDDCLANNGWLQSIVDCAQHNQVDIIEGQTVIPDKVDSPFKQGVENLQGGCFWSCNLAVKRLLFRELNGFDTDFEEAGGEDMEFAWRIQHQGLTTKFLPEALVLHPVRSLNFKAILWRTFLIRWLLLYQLKTNPTVNLNDSYIKVFPILAWQRSLSLLRETWHLFARFDAQNWRSKTFWQLWNIITFPVVLPYLFYWQWRFRKLLLTRR